MTECGVSRRSKRKMNRRWGFVGHGWHEGYMNCGRIVYPRGRTIGLDERLRSSEVRYLPIGVNKDGALSGDGIAWKPVAAFDAASMACGYDDGLVLHTIRCGID